MRALRFLEPRKLEVQEVPKPIPGPGDCLLKICACGICGSDPAGYTGRSGRRIPPMTMGHEFAAVVEETGEEVKNFKAGDKVIVQPINWCGECENCKRGLTMLCLNKIFYGVLTTDGAMAEYLVVPEKQLYRKPEGLSDYEAALAEPYAVTYGAYRKAGSLKDQIVLIVGAGTIGDCLLQLVLLDKPKNLKTSSYWVIRRFVRDYAIQYRSAYTHLQGVFLRVTRNISCIPIEHFKREVGQSGYTLSKLMSLWANIIGFSIVPLRAATLLGYFFSMVGLIGIIAVIVRKIVRPVTAIGWPSVMVSIFFFSGLLLFFMGLIGEYIGRIFLGLCNNPQFVVRQVDEQGSSPYLINEDGKKFVRAEESREGIPTSGERGAGL